MSERTYTLSEVSRLLREEDDDDAAGERLMRQIKHWTSLGLISPVEKHTGSGVSRRYRANEIRKAAILVEISRYHVPVTVLGRFATAMGEFCKLPEWTEAIRGRRAVLIAFTFGRDYEIWDIQYGDKPNPLAAKAVGDPPASELLINVTRLFSRLRSLVQSKLTSSTRQEV